MLASLFVIEKFGESLSGLHNSIACIFVADVHAIYSNWCFQWFNDSLLARKHVHILEDEVLQGDVSSECLHIHVK